MTDTSIRTICKAKDTMHISGLSFESVCLEHIKQIKQALGISGVLSKEYAITPSEEDYRKRIADFTSITKNRRPVIFTMITPYGVLKNSHSGIVSKSLTLENLMAI